MSGRILIIVGVAFALLAGDSQAESASGPDLRRSGPYLQVGGLGAIAAYKSEVTDNILSPTGGGSTLAAGYHFNSWYALEADFQWARMNDDVQIPVAGGFNDRWLEGESWSLMLSGKLYPLADAGIRIQPYLKLGLGYMRTRTSDVSQAYSCTPGCSLATTTKLEVTNSGFGLKVGLGADIPIYEWLYGYVDYAFNNGVSNDIELLDYHSIGMGVGVRW